MKGFFVNSSVRPNQGWTDFGYYVDGDNNPRCAEDFEDLVEQDDAYRMEVFVNYREGVHIRLRSNNRRVTAEVDEDIGFRSRGLETTLYQATGSPRLPSTYDNRPERNQALTSFAEYALNHSKSSGIGVENIDWDSLLEDKSGL